MQGGIFEGTLVAPPMARRGALWTGKVKSGYQGSQQIDHENANGGCAKEVNFYVANTHGGDFREI